MRHAGIVREELVKELGVVLHRLKVRLSFRLPDEFSALHALEQPQRDDLLVELVNLLMLRMGHVEPKPKDPRYDKTLRAVNKQTPKGPRGTGTPRGPVAARRARALATRRTEAPDHG